MNKQTGSERLTGQGHLASSGRAGPKPMSAAELALHGCPSASPQVSASCAILTPCGGPWLPAPRNCTPLLCSLKTVLENTDRCRQGQSIEQTPAIPTAHHHDEYCSAPTAGFYTHTLGRDCITQQARGASPWSLAADPVSRKSLSAFLLYFIVTDSKMPRTTQHSR